MPVPFLITDIEAWCLRHEARAHDGNPDAALTVLQHALQCAQLAEWAHADDALVAAALLHRICRLTSEGLESAGYTPEMDLIERHYGADVLEPIRLQPSAQRYLAAVDAAYLAALAPAALAALNQQGGPMPPAEVTAFESKPQAMNAVQVRRWSELAGGPLQRTPPLDYYLALLEDLYRSRSDREKLEVGPQTV